MLAKGFSTFSVSEKHNSEIDDTLGHWLDKHVKQNYRNKLTVNFGLEAKHARASR